MLKGQKGITLVALVITIIVLLILAGVTINLTLGNNGIWKSAEGAANNYTNAQNQELTQMNTFENDMEHIIYNTTEPTTTEPID